MTHNLGNPTRTERFLTMLLEFCHKKLTTHPSEETVPDHAFTSFQPLTLTDAISTFSACLNLKAFPRDALPSKRPQVHLSLLVLPYLTCTLK